MHRFRVRERAKIGADLVIDSSRSNEAWKMLFGQTDERIGFIVAQEDVIFWLELLDERIFQ